MDLIAGLFTLISPLAGGALRLVPELLKMWSSKKSEDHEFRMTNLTLEDARIRAREKLAQTQAENAGAAELEALKVHGAAFQEPPSGVAWVDAWNKAMRPAIATNILILYTLYKVAGLVLAVAAGWATSGALGAMGAIRASWTQEDSALLGTVVGFWYVNRSLMR